MNEADTAGQQVTIGNLPADTDEEGNPGLNLMPIRKPTNPVYFMCSASSFPRARASERLHHDCAVALSSTKSVPKQVGRIQDVQALEHPDRMLNEIREDHPSMLRRSAREVRGIFAIDDVRSGSISASRRRSVRARKSSRPFMRSWPRQPRCRSERGALVGAPAAAQGNRGRREERT
jgi:hypothetical protein